ncbi:MAG: peptidoglycan-binding protein [Phycicoccus sp.]|nr:peptidoglycan-binding protein [Phycicoccus sp.]
MKFTRGAIALAVATATVLATAVSAQAYSSGYSDLSHLPVLGVSYVNQGNVVGLWQNILYTDIDITKCLSVNPNAIDGHFGTGSRGGTISWQRAHGIGADGIVGNGTWTKASQNLVDVGLSEYGTYESYSYVGTIYDFRLAKLNQDYTPPNTWAFVSVSNPASDWIQFSWPGITFYTC